MSNDYLWDRSGPPDPDVERLEKMLGQFRQEGPTPEFQMPVRQMPRRPVRWKLVSLAAAAALLAAVSVTWYWNRPAQPSMEVARLKGTPRIGSDPMGGTGKIAVGQWLVTDAGSRARIDVGLIGEVEVEPNSRIGLLRTRPSEHRLALEYGKMRARIWAPPGLFFVETPSATAIDLGCTYTLEVDDKGAGELRVTKGWVSFEWEGRESFVPEGAMCQTRPGVGPGTPYREDAPEALRSALRKLDFELRLPTGGVPGGVTGGVEGGIGGGVEGGVSGGVAGGVEGLKRRRAEMLGTVLSESRKEDALTLWHLLVRMQGTERGRVYDRMAELVPPPEGVSREGILRTDRPMLDRWWNELGLKQASWWRMWKGPWPPRAQ